MFYKKPRDVAKEKGFESTFTEEDGYKILPLGKKRINEQ
jgi:hypothetical protein